MSAFNIEPVDDSHRPRVKTLLTEFWGSAQIITRGKIHQADELPGFVAVMEPEITGMVTYRIDSDECEIISLNSLVERMGIGTSLINAVRRAASSEGCKRLWLITTNDNLHAIRFYQKRGFTMAALHKNALEESRKLKPEIPVAGIDGIPLRDEIEMEMFL